MPWTADQFAFVALGYLLLLAWLLLHVRGARKRHRCRHTPATQLVLNVKPVP